MTMVEMSPPPGGAWLQTWRGRAWVADAPEAYPYDVEEISHATSNLCRFVGHPRFFYPVAHHSVLVAEEVSALSDGNRELVRWALLHDAAEAFWADLPAPLKHMPELAGYRAGIKRTERAIAARFGLLGCVDHPIVKRADLVLLATERRDVLSPSPHSNAWIDLPPPRDERIEEWGPALARDRLWAAWIDAGGALDGGFSR